MDAFNKYPAMMMMMMMVMIHMPMIDSICGSFGATQHHRHHRSFWTVAVTDTDRAVVEVVLVSEGAGDVEFLRQ